MRDRMLLRLYAVPLLLAVAAFVMLWVLGLVLPDLFAGSSLLAPLGRQVQGLAVPVCWALTGAATLAAAYQTVRLWRWSAGKTDSCHHCGGMISARDGRYGPYVRCLACGANRSLR